MNSCELYTKIQKMKAIHNYDTYSYFLRAAVNYTQRYKKWKQFTTNIMYVEVIITLWTIHKDTKNESNSQLHRMLNLNSRRCELYTKIQKMKAIHNRSNLCHIYGMLWTIHKDTKNESNSQLPVLEYLVRRAVNYTQRYKKWKQFTTRLSSIIKSLLLWAIHKDTKNESNSQQLPVIHRAYNCCELYTKIQKMKAIHNYGG